MLSSLAWAGPAAAAPLDRVASLLGQLVAAHLAKLLPPPHANTPTDPRGGQFCDVMAALGWPPPAAVVAELTATPRGKRALAPVLVHGAKYCGWHG